LTDIETNITLKSNFKKHFTGAVIDVFRRPLISHYSTTTYAKNIFSIYFLPAAIAVSLVQLFISELVQGSETTKQSNPNYTSRDLPYATAWG
jgi:hypothetical protein